MSNALANEPPAEEEVAGSPTEPTVVTENDGDFDPDQADLDAAKAEADAEAKDVETQVGPEGDEAVAAVADPAPADLAQPAPAPAPAADPAKPAEPAPAGDTTAAQPAADPIMVPKARLDEANQKRNEAVLQNAYLKGQLDQAAAQRQAPAAAGDPAQSGPVEPEQTPEQRIAAVREKKFELAEELDRGSLTTREYAEAVAKLDDAEFEIRREQLAPPDPAPAVPAADAAQQQTVSTDLYLDQLTAQLEEKHPYLALIGDVTTDPVARERIEHLAAEARLQLEAEGIAITNDARGDYAVRQRVAALSDGYGKVWFPDAQVRVLVAEPSNNAAPTTQGGLTPRQTATAAKVAQAEAAPPDTFNLGTGDTGTEATVAEVEAKIERGDMDEEEILALPEPIRAKIRGDT